MNIRLAIALLPALASGSAFGATAGMAIDLGPGDGERRTVTYECEGRDPITVTYLNVAPNFLAVLPVENETLVFASVISDRGARYVASQWVWTMQGPEGRLYDVGLGEDAPPVAECLELNNIP